MRHHWTNAALLCAGIYLADFTGQAQAQTGCTDWNTEAFFKTATVANVIHCLGQGVDIEARAKAQIRGWTPLMFAARFSTVEIVNVLLNAGADVEPEPKYSFSRMYLPLHEAVKNGKTEIVIVLLNAGAYIDRRARGMTPLHEAARSETSTALLVNTLLDWGADIQAQDSILGYTPLHWAESTGTAEVARALKDAGAYR